MQLEASIYREYTHSLRLHFSKPLLNCYPNSADALPYVFKIIPVNLYGSNGKMKTFAMFDNGSAVTLLEEVSQINWA